MFLPSIPEVQELEKFIINKMGFPSIVLMENAAQKIFLEVKKIINKKPYNKVVIISGNSNNGADGLAVARKLNFCYLEDLPISVFLYKSEKYSQENQIQQNILKNLKSNSLKLNKFDLNDLDTLLDEIDSKTILIDAIFGIGLKGVLRDNWNSFFSRLNLNNKSFTISLDIPSGISSSAANQCIESNLTLTLGYIKKELYAPHYRKQTKEIRLLDIQFPNHGVFLADKVRCKAKLVNKSLIKSIYLKRNFNSHKGTYGGAAFVVGDTETIGATLLAAKASYLVGSGITYVLHKEEDTGIIKSLAPELVSIIYDFKNNKLNFKNNDFVNKITSMSIGSGYGKDEKEFEAFLDYFKEQKIVIDADGISILSKNQSILNSLSTKKDILLTPHVKEFSNLIGESISDIKQFIYDYGYEFVKKHNIKLCVKDFIMYYFEDEKTLVNLGCNPGLAKGGSGDLLVGIITGFLSQGYNYYNSCSIAMYIFDQFKENMKAKAISIQSYNDKDLLDCVKHILYEIEEDYGR